MYYTLRRYDSVRDLSHIYKVFSDYSEQYKLCSVINANSYESFPQLFERKIAANFNDFLIIEFEDQFAGFLASYDYKVIDGHIKAMMYLEKKYRKGTIGLAGIEFANLLFQYYNIHKIYTEVYAYNIESLNYHEHIGFKEECRLKNYKYFDGKNWDVIYYSILRDDFYEQNNRVINHFLKVNSINLNA